MEPLPFRDPGLPLAERVQDLLSRLTLAEKISQMLHGAQAIPRLDIPAYNYWSEALHGIGRNGRATVFPQAIALAATWDPGLIQSIAGAIADEGRAKFHAALRRRGETGQYQGLTFWSPNINIFRDPRWGRGQETYGEDPHLTGVLGAAFVRGLQGDDPRYLKAAACAKHFAVHSGPEKDRHTFDARVSPRDLHDTYLPAFKQLVTEAKVEAVMGAYNRVNGDPCCAHPYLLGEVLRATWGFTGHVVSDCWALTDIHAGHHVAADAVEAGALALTRGCDLSCGVTFDQLGEALTRGLISVADLDRALARTLATRFKLGLFDPPEQVPFAATPLSVLNSPAHQALARAAAQQAVVLLKNNAQTLPIADSVRRLFVTGPAAASVDVLLGNYHGLSDTLTTFVEGLVGRAPEGLQINYRPGSQFTQPDANPLNWAVSEAAESDLVIACLGLAPALEGEEGEATLSAQSGDRADLSLPPVQVEFLRQLAKAGARIVLVVTGGSPLALGEIEDLAQAILWVWYPGQAGGQAVADVLFGEVAPSGKLPITFPKSVADLPPFDDYRMAGRTYRYATAEPLYPFGYGLSYTRFAYSQLSLAAETLTPGETASAQFTLTNLGAVAAAEVVQVYLSDLAASAPVPIHKLIGFQRVHLLPGESRQLTAAVTPEQMRFIDEAGQPQLEPGEFQLTIGGCSPGLRGVALGAPAPVTARFNLKDTKTHG